MKIAAGLLVVGVLVAASCGGGSDEVSEPATTPLARNAALPTSTSAPAATTTQALTTTTVLLVEVPDLVGQTVDFAEGVLSVIGLVLVVDASQETQGESGVIFEQLPEAGTDVTPDTPVVVKVPTAATTTTTATTSTMPTVRTVEIELADASAEVEEVTISLEAEVHIQVGGFKPFSVVTIELHSEPVELVVAVADADGWIDVKATIPEDTDVGEHEIHIDGVDASDEPVEILIPAEIVEVAPTAAEATTTTVASTTTAAPVLVVDEESVLTFGYVWGPSEEAAALQILLGLTADGWYGPGTQAAHIAELEARGLPTDDVPNSPPTTTTTTLPPTTTVAVEGITEPDDSALDDYGSGQAGGIAYGGDDDCAYGDYDCLSTESGSVALAMSVFFTLTLLGGMGMMAWQALRREEDSTWV